MEVGEKNKNSKKNSKKKQTIWLFACLLEANNKYR